MATDDRRDHETRRPAARAVRGTRSRARDAPDVGATNVPGSESVSAAATARPPAARRSPAREPSGGPTARTSEAKGRTTPPKRPRPKSGSGKPSPVRRKVAGAKQPKAPVAGRAAKPAASPDAASPEAVEPEVRETLESGAVPLNEQLYDIERKLDRLLSDAGSVDGDPVARRRAAEALSQIATRLAPDTARDNPEDSLLGTARGLLSTDYYFRQWGRVAMRSRSEEVDDFGLDHAYERRLLPLFELLYERWFRVRADGVDNVPADGRVLIVCNHSGTVPLDGVMLKVALRLAKRREELRWLTEDFVFHMPFVGVFMNRFGAVRACQENAERLLAQEKAVAVFPEGTQGIGKLYRHRYQLQRFGRGGYVKLALRTGTPLVPAAVIGAEEANPLLFKFSTRGMTLPYIPLTPTFPWFGPLGLFPLPTRWRIIFGEPIDLSSHGPAAAGDAVLVNRLNEKVRTTIQAMIDQALARRTSVFFG